MHALPSALHTSINRQGNPFMLNNARYLLVAGVVLFAGCAAQEPASIAAKEKAAPLQETELAGNEQAKRDPDERICRRVLVTGTNFRKQQCFTRRELEEASAQTQEFLNRNKDANELGGSSQ